LKCGQLRFLLDVLARANVHLASDMALKGLKMNGLVLANRSGDWQRLKALVLDSVSSPITRDVQSRPE
jgi:hypothetical protein